MTAALNREIFAALVEELGIVVGAMIDSPATAWCPARPPWAVNGSPRFARKARLAGALTVVLDHDGATAITRLMTGIEGDIPDEALLDTLREVLAQAVSALALKPVARGAKLSVADVVDDRGSSAGRRVVLPTLSAPRNCPTALAVTTWGSVSAAPVAAAKPAPGPKAVPQSAPAPAKAPETSAGTFDDRIDVILDIDLPLVVRFGRTELPLKALTRMGPGSVIDLGRSPDDPVEVLVSNRVVARGEVVIVSGSYGIRILDVVSQRERVRSMEA